jgi:fructose transport system substrate-binding protein
MRRAGAAEAPARKQEETAMIRSQRSALAPNPRRLAGLLAAGVVGLALAAGSTAAMAQEAIVGLVTKTEVNPFFVKMRQAAEAEAKAKGLISAGAKGILITPNNSTGVLGAVKKARDAGILVIALDTATDPADAVDATFATDNFQAGVQQGQYARKALGDKAPKLAMLDGSPGGTVDTFRHDGFLKGFGIAEGDAAIVGKQNTNGAQDKGQTAMENLLSAHPDINVVYTINEPAAQGAYAAIRAAGKESDIVVTSIDGGCLGVKYVKDGRVAATVMQFPYKMAQMGVDAVAEYAKSGKKPTGFVNTGSFLITGKPLPGLDSKDLEFGEKNCWG